MHFSYDFTLERGSVAHAGAGELWLSFADGAPRLDVIETNHAVYLAVSCYYNVLYIVRSSPRGSMDLERPDIPSLTRAQVPRLRISGVAKSQRFGKGEITVVVDGGEMMMYSLFKLQVMDGGKVQCLKYPFPDAGGRTEAPRLARLRRRRQEFSAGMKRMSETAEQSLDVRWTNRSSLRVVINAEDQIETIKLQRGSCTVKNVMLRAFQDDASTDMGSVFEPPRSDCALASDVSDPAAELQLGPHKSAALADILLLLSARATEDSLDWPQPFVALMALMVPGDVAVLIEDPAPPNFAALGGIAFRYSSMVFSLAKSMKFDDPALDIDQSGEHSSDGTMLIDLQDRSFRLHEGAASTKVQDSSKGGAVEAGCSSLH